MTESGASGAAPRHSEPVQRQSAAPASPTDDAGAVLWAHALQAVANLIAHDLRNALNAVAVNLEVVRGRSARGAEAAAIAPFAATAAAQFETAAAAAEALLTLTRPESSRIDVAAFIVRLARLTALAGRERIRVSDNSGGKAIANVPPDIARATVARSVLTALATDENLSCVISVDDGILVHVTGATSVPSLPDSDLLNVSGAHGITVALRGQSLELRFPAVD